jgi:hypothetical protein
MSHRALALRLQNIDARQKTLPKIFEEGAVDGLQRRLVGSIHTYVQLGDGNERLHFIRELYVRVNSNTKRITKAVGHT